MFPAGNVRNWGSFVTGHCGESAKGLVWETGYVRPLRVPKTKRELEAEHGALHRESGKGKGIQLGGFWIWYSIL